MEILFNVLEDGWFWMEITFGIKNGEAENTTLHDVHCYLDISKLAIQDCGNYYADCRNDWNWSVLCCFVSAKTNPYKY